MAENSDKNETISSVDELRLLYGEASEHVKKIRLLQLEKHSKNFIRHSPFICMASVNEDGSCEVSPRGDPPGFVEIIDDHTLLLPDRKGNNRVDSLVNIISNPHVSLAFFVPGILETVRVRGKAQITTDAKILEGTAIDGKAPKSALLIKIDEVFLHCGKAVKRSRIWEDDYKIDRKDFPSLGQMVTDQIDMPKTREELDEHIEKAYEEGLY